MRPVIRHWETFCAFFLLSCSVLLPLSAVAAGAASIRLHESSATWRQIACITATLHGVPLNQWAMDRCELSPWNQETLVEWLRGAPRSSGLNRHIYYSSLIAMIAAGLISFFFAYHLSAVREVHLRGRRLENLPRKADGEMRGEAGGRGIRIHPKVRLSRERETRGILLLGNPGSGKTVILTQLVDEILARGDRVILHDVKGDFASRYLNSTKSALLAPWDERSARWAATDDIQTASDARSFCERLVPASNDPMWSNAARQVLVGLLVHLIARKPGAWSFKDVENLISLGYPELRKAVLDGNPVAAQLLPPEPDRTTDGILSNLVASIGPITDIAASEVDGKKKVSIRRWLLEQRAEDAQLLLIGNNQRYGSLGRTFAQWLFDVARQIAVGPELADDKDRRVWIVFDEAVQLGKIDGLSSLIETGRSRGICVVIALQDIAQWRHVYSDDEADALMSMIGTHVYCRVSLGETSRYLAEAIGKREILRPVRSSDDSDIVHMDRALEYVVSPSEFGSSLGPKKGRGVQALLAIGGQNVYKLTWPFTSNVERPAPANVPALWTQSASIRLDSNRNTTRTGPQPRASSTPNDPETRNGGADILDDVFGDEAES